MTSDIATQHKSAAPVSIRCAVVTVSDTRTLETDRGGELVVELLTSADHVVVRREILPDEPTAMKTLIAGITSNRPDDVQAILMTGGTGITSRDQTFETVSAMFARTLPGYGELFRMLSYQEIGSAAMLSRAVGGVVGKTILLTMPGSPAAVELAMERLVLPELAHLVQQANA